jgi:Glycosyltransferase family 87
VRRGIELRKVLTPGRSRAIRHGLLLAGILALAAILAAAWLGAASAFAATQGQPYNGTSGAGEAYDARTYWQAYRDGMYERPVLGAPVAYYYSPAFLQVLAPLLILPFPAFLAAWYLLQGVTLTMLVRSWLPLVLAAVFVPLEVVRGNLEVLMAAAIVLGFRWPAAWSFILLTKVTPGIGLLWFVARREWRKLAMALGATAVIAGVSFVIAPALWFQWIDSLVHNTGVNIDWPYFPVPLIVRLPIAAILVWLGARRDWPWMVPVAATLASPALWPVNLTLLVAAIPLATGRATGVLGSTPATQAPAKALGPA